jgi:hypothetical protein
VWLVQPERVYGRASIGYGMKAVPLVAARPLARSVRVDRPLVEQVVAPSAIGLPVKRGERIGEIRVYSGKTLIARSPLVAGRSAHKPGFGGRLGYYAGRTLDHIGGWFS